ncbi:MAG TPA: serine/threonine-protein kinase, partial [Longimicrobium sp.]|nr:serine/threonine-protein kinase [Longimicrobium sp.]
MPKVRYQPLGPLLSGKGSRAFLALEIPENAPKQSRPVVMIWLPEELASDPASLASVERETHRAVVLDHPNIIRVFGLVQEKEGVARVVEFADGESLRRVLEVAPRLPVGIAARVIVDAAMGVHYAHLAGNDDGSPMVHGDLRPETLLVTYGGVSKVSGYGALAVAPKEPGGRRVRGRRSHCAPEQVVGGRDAVNVQTDVYLLGVALYECLTGKVPFQDAPNFDQAVLNDPPPSIPADECPPALAEVIQRAMSKKATERYPSALALREAIEQAMGELPSHASFANYLKNFFPE